MSANSDNKAFTLAVSVNNNTNKYHCNAFKTATYRFTRGMGVHAISQWPNKPNHWSTRTIVSSNTNGCSLYVQPLTQALCTSTKSYINVTDHSMYFCLRISIITNQFY